MRFPGTFIILVELFVRVLIASNILTAKLIHLEVTALLVLGRRPGVLTRRGNVFSVRYIIGEALTEVGELSNSATLTFLKFRTQGRVLWVRTIGSTIVGQ